MKRRHPQEQGVVEFIDSDDGIREIWKNAEIVKLHYQKAATTMVAKQVRNYMELKAFMIERKLYSGIPKTCIWFRSSCNFGSFHESC